MDRRALVVLAVLVVGAVGLAPAPPATEPADDPIGVCVHARPVDPTHDHCLWLTA